MRVRFAIVLLLAVIATSFTLGLLAMREAERLKFAQLAQERARAWQRSVEGFLDRQGASLAKMAEHFAAMDAVVTAILDDDAAKARQTLAEGALKDFAAHAVWVCRRDGSPFFTNQIITPTEALPLPLTPADVQALFRDRRRHHFYFALSRTDPARPRFIEVRGERVHPAWDHAGTSPAEGYFFAGRLIDEVALAEMPLLSADDRIQLRGAADAPRPGESGRAAMVFSRALADWRGRPLGHLVLSNNSGAIAMLEGRAEDLFAVLLGGSLALLALLYLVLGYAVLRPISLLVRGLRGRDMAALTPLEGRQSEFGELSRLIHRFHDQSEDLIRETRERASTQEALRRTEEMLLHSQKMDAIGRLAGGVAHDFNNLLTAIIGYADFLMRRLSGDPTSRAEARLIHQAGEKAAALTRQLLAFSRKQLLQPKVIDLNLVVDGLQQMLQRIIGEHIEVRTEIADQLWHVRADAGQIEQVIVNLSVNARDAMPRGGRLTIHTSNLSLDAKCEEAQIQAGDYVALEVTDVGEGMDAETKKRIFEPFFTTKEPGRGTGLGLATVYGIVRQSGGGIIVESERGVGTTFRILLPRADAPLEQAEAPTAPVPAAGRAERVLFVEDDPFVRDLMSIVLREQGYDLITAESGGEAIGLAERHGSAIDLLISDVVMPDLSGIEVAKRVRFLAPEARVLFVSGYSEADISDHGHGTVAFDVLQKPFRPDELARKVREVLDAAHRTTGSADSSPTSIADPEFSAVRCAPPV